MVDSDVDEVDVFLLDRLEVSIICGANFRGLGDSTVAAAAVEGDAVAAAVAAAVVPISIGFGSRRAEGEVRSAGPPDGSLCRPCFVVPVDDDDSTGCGNALRAREVLASVDRSFPGEPRLLLVDSSTG